MKYETSAGGVIVASKNHRWQILLIKDKSGQWTFPKGLVEKNELKETAARREIGEEAGIRKLKLVSAFAPIEYFYRWEGKLIKKNVFYFLFKNGGEEKLSPQREEGILEVHWFSLEDAKKIIGYPKTNTGILKEVETRLISIKR